MNTKSEFEVLYTSRGLTAMDVSRGAKCAYATVLALRDGDPKASPNWKTLKKIADTIGVSVAEVARAIEGRPQKPPQVHTLCELATRMTDEHRQALLTLAQSLAGFTPAL